MIYAFGNYEVDTLKRELRRGEDLIEIEPRAFTVLVFLLANRDRAVSREDLLAECWSGVYVSSGTVTRCLTRVRSAIGQQRSAETPIKTLHAHGYRFVGPVRTSASTANTDNVPTEVSTSIDTRPVPKQMPETSGSIRFVTRLSCTVALNDNSTTGHETLHGALRSFVYRMAPTLETYQAVLWQDAAGDLTIQLGHLAASERTVEHAFELAERMLRDAPDSGLVAKVGVATDRAVAGGAAGLAAVALVTGLDLRPDLICQQAQPGEWLCDTTSARLAARTHEVLLQCPAVKDLPKALRVQRRSSDPSVLGALPMFGRTSERVHLEQLWHKASRGSGGLVAVSGEVGIGKTRLVQEIADIAERDGAKVLFASASPLRRAKPFGPIVSLLYEILDVGAGSSPVRLLASIETGLEAAGWPVEESLPLLASILTVSTDGQSSPELHLDETRQRDRSLGALVALLRLAAKEKPALLVLEDYHLADPSTRDTVKLLAETLEEDPILFVLALRNEGDVDENLPDKTVRMPLGPLSRAETARLLGAYGELAGLPVSELDRISQRSEGVPLYLCEFLAAAEQGRTASDDVPDTLEALMQARLDGTGDAKAVAQWAAVVGRTFEIGLLEVAMEAERTSLEDAVKKLVGQGLIDPLRGTPGAFTFHHGLIQEGALASMLESDRMIAERRVAEAMMSTVSNWSKQATEDIARRFEVSDQPERATEIWASAGRASQSGLAVNEAQSRAVSTLAPSKRRSTVQLIEEIEHLLKGF